MDERHWWIAKRISQAFNIDSSSPFLEKLICEEDNLEKINFFLCMNGTNKLFVCGEENVTTGASEDPSPPNPHLDQQLLILDDLLKVPKSFAQQLDNSIVLYFIRHDVNHEVNPAQIHKEIFCGEIRNVSQILFNVYNDLLFTMFEADRNWSGSSGVASAANELTKVQAIRNMEKYVNTIGEFSTESQNQKNMILKRVDSDALNELKQARMNADSPVIKYCEDLALEWMVTIENILSDICDEKIIHQSVGPSSELERWQRKQRLLSNLTEQLKSKECKTVMSALITCKSKVIKKWKVIDTGITDAQNECRDKVKFLESLKRSLDHFYNDATPLTCVTFALPNLCTSMRTIESVSRYYARQGYLGLLFTKITNQLVNICKDYLIEMAQLATTQVISTSSKDSSELAFWPVILKEIDEYENNLEKLIDLEDFNLSVSLSKSKPADLNESMSRINETLFGRLKSCILLQVKYKEAFRNLRDALGGNQALSNFPSVSSALNPDLNNNMSSQDTQSSSTINYSKKIGNRRNESMRINGILMSEENIIFGHLDTFCNRIKCVCDQIISLAQFQALYRVSFSLSRPKREDLSSVRMHGGKDASSSMASSPNDEEDNEDDIKSARVRESASASSRSRAPIAAANSSNLPPPPIIIEEDMSNKMAQVQSLGTLVEENESEMAFSRLSVSMSNKRTHTSEGGSSKVKMPLAKDKSNEENVSSDSDFDENEDFEEEEQQMNELIEESDQINVEGNVGINADKLFKMENNIESDSKKIMRKAQSLCKEDLKLMKKYYNRKDEGPTVSSIIENNLKEMKNMVTSVNAAQLLDVETKNAKFFQDSYNSFLNSEVDLERFLAAYLNVIFIKPKTTHEGLHILTKFDSISHRSMLRPIINDKYVEIFSNYEKDLDEVETSFESFKLNPPMLRNAPPIGGSISWVRQMLKKIEKPMKVFRDIKYLTTLSDFPVILKKYTRITTAMVAFENYYLNSWKSTIEDARNGLKVFLMKKNLAEKTFEINSDPRLLILFQECKWLMRMNIEIPQSAKDLLTQEKKYKHYKSNLDMLLVEFNRIVKMIPKHLIDLFEVHIKQTLELCNQGCVILTWSSLNIDSFLVTIENGLNQLNSLVRLVVKSKEEEIFEIINQIRNTCLFDKELAFSKKWNPKEFVYFMKDSVANKAEEIRQKYTEIQLHIEQIGCMLIANPNSKKKSKLTLKELTTLDPKLNELIDFYAENLYMALNDCITNTLKCLAKSCGFQFEEDDSLGMTYAGRNTPEDYLKYTRIKSGEQLPRPRSSIMRSISGGGTDDQRSVSVSKVLTKMTWSDERKFEEAFLKLEFVLKYSIPDIITEPSLDICQTSMKSIANDVLEVSKVITWRMKENNSSFYESISQDENIRSILSLFNCIITEIGPAIKKHMMHFKLFEFLWKEDLNHLFTEFIKHNRSSEFVIRREVERLATIEKCVHDVPAYLNVGSVSLNTQGVKSALRTFAYEWKCKYASVLHELARERLEKAIVYRESVQKRLAVNVQTLEQLNDALVLLEELGDMENKIDEVYLPIENCYADLQRYELILTRLEIEQVTSLREMWVQLMRSAEAVRTTLLQDKRNQLEQELDKQVKTFVVEVIRFRNSFDATGPCVPGIDPHEAIRRLADFQKQYETFDARRKTLDSISILFGLHCKPFPELDKTGEELALLNHLYRVYEGFLAFDRTFRATLWSECDLNRALVAIREFWVQFQALPDKLKENWDAYDDLKRSLKKYIDVMPILLRLNEKEIRNRHWMQVMQVVKVSFRLESSIFKLNDLIDIGLEKHKREIEEICLSAKKEQELESKMRSIEEEWNEQVLSFNSYKDYGEICLDKRYTEQLLEQLEDAQESLANMLTSRYVGPLRGEVASWSEKLKTICEVLELWIEVQDLWVNLESAFSHATTIKEMPSEAKRFSRIDKTWTRSQKQSYDMKSVIQCCLGSSVQENTKRALLKDIQKEFEICFRSLNAYLEKKRRSFPRYYFLSNPALLTLLNYNSNTNNLNDVKMHLSSLFANVYELKLEEIKEKQVAEENLFSNSSERIQSRHVPPSVHLKQQQSFDSLSQNRFESTVNQALAKRLDASKKQDQQTQRPTFEISEVQSRDGESLVLFKRVPIDKGAESWMPRLKEAIGESLRRYMSMSLVELNLMASQQQIMTSSNTASATTMAAATPIEELALKYPTQACLVALAYVWTKEVESSLVEMRNERKAGNVSNKKFAQITARFLGVLSKARWGTGDRPLLNSHRIRLESMITYSSYLRDAYDAISSKKIRDLNDFEWQKCFRVYLTEANQSQPNPKFCLLDDTYQYGSEFYGAEQDCVITPVTERCFLTIWQASRMVKACLVSGKSNAGKTQTCRGFAQHMGKFIRVLYCTQQTDHVSVANCLQGVAQEGAWALFDEIQNLTPHVLSWFFEYSNGIFQALRKKSNQILLSDGKDIQVNPNFLLISTLNSAQTTNNNSGMRTAAAAATNIPAHFKSAFRVVALVEPDVEQVLRAKCLRYGMRAPNILAARLRILYELYQDIIGQNKSNLTIASLISVVRTLYVRQHSANAANEESADSRTTSSVANHSANKYGTTKNEILTNQSTSVKELARKSRQSLLNYAKNEHSMVGQAIIELISPRLNTEDAKIFKKLVQDVFMMKDDMSKISALNQQPSVLTVLEKIVIDKATNDFKLYPNKHWIEKCLQIYTLSNTFKSLILCGSPCSGKTSTLSVLVEALSELNNDQSITGNPNNITVFKKQKTSNNLHKIKRVNNSAVDDESILFGTLAKNNAEFKDGLITNMIRKALRNQSTTWLCLDGPILPNWCSNFNSVLDSDLYMELKNGDHLRSMCKVVFETGNIGNSDPSFLAKSGIIYFGDEIIGWRSIARSWLEAKTQSQILSLQKCFNSTMDAVSNYVLKECKPLLPVREESLFASCLSLLGAMLGENPNLGGEVHIERIYLYCLIWTFGGVLNEADQKGFSELLYKLVSALPDDDLKSSVFEYYVDESGEWDLWSQRVPETIYTDNVDLLGNVFVDTIDSVRCRVFLELSNFAKQNVLLFGPNGCGKSKLMQEFTQNFDANLNIVKRMNFSGATKVNQMQKFIESNIVHRQGFTYGAIEKKHLSVFIDDLNAPISDKFGIQRCNEFIRQLIDAKFIYSLTKSFELKKLEEINFLTTMTYQPNSQIDPRLLRHFTLIYLPLQSGSALKSIFHGTLEASMFYNERSGLEAELHTALVDASCSLLDSVNQVLKPCPMPGRQHYMFNMKSIITTLQGLRKLNDTQRNECVTVISFWRDEIYSTIGCQLTRNSDLNWLENCVDDLIKQKFSNFIGSQNLIQNFAHFNLESKNYERSPTDLQNKQIKANLTQYDSIENVRGHLEQVFNRYKEEFGFNQINIFLSNNAAQHIIRIHRILSFTQCGNLLLIGAVGNHLTSFIKLAFYLADIQLLTIDCSRSSLFYDSMRAAVRSAGAENKSVGLIFSSKDLYKEEYLDTINSLLNNAECNDLFSNDEMDGLYHAISASIKREYPNMMLEPRKFFNMRVKRNLHICLTLAPSGQTMRLILRSYAGIVSNTQVYWARDWTPEYLRGEAEYFMRERFDSAEMRERLVRCMSDVHSFMLDECRQAPWSGVLDDRSTDSGSSMTVEQHAKKLSLLLPSERAAAKDLAKQQQQQQQKVDLVDNTLPYSKGILQELIKLEHNTVNNRRGGNTSKLHFFISSSTFLRFMNTFWYFFTKKARECENDINRLKRVLETLEKTREGARKMRAYIKELRTRCKKSETDSEIALKKLIEMTTKVEKLKAKLGYGGSLATLMQLNDYDAHNHEFAPDLKILSDEANDEFDTEFNRMRDESQRSKQAKMEEELERAKHAVEDLKRALAEKRKQVESWKNKVDRPCVERIRAFQNPPALIGQIMEMMIILIGKNKFPENSPVFKSSTDGGKDDENSKLNADKSKSRNKMERLDRAHWKQLQSLMQDSVKFVELLHTIEWEEGLPNEINQTVESYLYKSKDDQMGITGEGSLLDSSKQTNIAPTKYIDSTQVSKGITISGARYASEDAATLVHYCIAILEYSKLCGPLRAAKEQVELIRKEMAENERRKQELDKEKLKLKLLEEALNAESNSKPEEELKADDLQRLLNELEELQAKFDRAAVDKHKLNAELESCIQRLDAATHIIENMTNLEDQWKKWIEEHLTHEQTITNCIITAAFVSYCAPFERSTRIRICEFVAQCCLKHDIPKEPQKIFQNLALPEFLYSSIQLKEIELLRLPITENILENGCFLIEDRSYENWPLICDSSRRSVDWLKTYLRDKQFHILKYHDLKSVLETCLSEGHYLLLLDCDVDSIMANRKLETVLRNKSRFITSDKPFKLNFGNQEIECNPKFRLFLHTVSEPTSIPDYLAAYSLVVNFKLNRADIEEELLDRFLVLAKPRIDSEKFGLLQEKVDTLKIIDPLEQDITNFLASEVDLLNDIEPTKKLSDLKKLYDEAVDSNLRIELAEEPLIKTRESYREIAVRGAICYDVISSLRELNANYMFANNQFMAIFDEALYQFERSSTPQVIGKLTDGVILWQNRMMNESDRKVFAILLSTEIEAAAGRLNVGEREFIISPAYGALVVQIVNNKPVNESKYWQYKKPYDWMSDETFMNLQYLAASQSWFSDAFDRMTRDGRESQWRSFCEAEAPENATIPDKLEDLLTPIQRFCLLRAIRSDRIIQGALTFVTSVLGKNYLSSTVIDFESIYAESSANRIIIMTYLDEPESAKKYFINFAKTKIGPNSYSMIDVNSLGFDDSKLINRTLSKAMEEGTWVLLHNCHNSPRLLHKIESLVVDKSTHANVDANFRCWLSLPQQEATQSRYSSIFDDYSIRVFVGAPTTMRENMVRAFNWLDVDLVKTAARPEWSILLHNLCFFHGCLRLRMRYSRYGWNSPFTLNFTTEEFLESIRVASQQFSQADASSKVDPSKTDANRSASIQAIKFIVADLIYGCSASNDYDLQAIESIAEYWLGSIATGKRDFELAKLKYKIPGAFCTSAPKIGNMQQALESIPAYQLEAPEACHILPSPLETVLGDDVFILTRLNRLIDAMPPSSTNLKLFDRPLTPFDNPIVAQISMSSNNPLVYSSMMFSTCGYLATQTRKYNDLFEYCSTILAKIPKILSKEQINEKVRKNGGWTLFNQWIVTEMNTLINFIQTIKSQLQTIKNMTEGKNLGFDWNSDIIQVADSLYNQQIPKLWCILSGSRVHFPFYPLASFFSDLTVRAQHIERCLTLGREKIPAFNLSAYYNPCTLLSLFKYETLKNKNLNDEVGCVEALVFQSEFTLRDKDHLRDPPKEGIFVYGIYLWGCHWDKSTFELVDHPAKSKDPYLGLPVIHLTCWLESEKPILNETVKSQDLYKCPVYLNRSERDESLFELDMLHTGIPAQKWAMRGVCATLRPY